MPDNLSINRSDFQWYDPQEGSTSATDMGDYAGTNVTMGQTGGWGLTPEARARLGEWGTTNQSNVGWGNDVDADQLGLSFDQFFGGGGVSYDPRQGVNFNQTGLGERDWLDNFFNQKGFGGQMKTGEREATRYGWNRDGDSFVFGGPAGKFNVRTNNGAENAKALAALASVAGMGLAGPATTALGQAGQGVNMLNFATGGQLPGLREASLLAGLGGNIGSLTDLASKGVNSLSDLFKAGQAGFGAYQKGSKVMDTLTGGQSPLIRQPSAYGSLDGSGGAGYAADPRDWMKPNLTTTTGAQSGGGGFLDFLFGGAGGGRTGAMDLYGAYRGSKEARDEAERLKRMYEEAQGRRQPVLDRLNESYTNPNSFYDSNQWKGLSSVYQNSIDRGAAKTGRMANPTDREVLMQQHAMKGLEDYRGGLRQQAQLLNPDQYINPYMRGSTREAGALNPYFAMGGRGRVGGPGTQGGPGGLEQLIRQAMGAGGGAVERLIRQLGGGGEMTGGMGSANPDEYGGLDPFTGAPEISYGQETIPGMEYNNLFPETPTGFEVPGNFGSEFGGSAGDISDLSWINDFSFDY